MNVNCTVAGKVNEEWPAELNKLVWDGGHDLVLSIGQVSRVTALRKITKLFSFPVVVVLFFVDGDDDDNNWWT